MNEINTFKNEVIHFFNIDSINSSIYIYIEIEGKKIQSESTKENYYKIILKDLGIKSEKKELNCKLFDNIELKILIRIINKYGIRKSSIFQNKIIEEKPGKKRGNTHFAPSIFRQNEKIKIFSGEFINKQIFKNNVIPGKLKMPSLFSKKKKKKTKENKIEDIKDNINDNNCNNNDNN